MRVHHRLQSAFAATLLIAVTSCGGVKSPNPTTGTPGGSGSWISTANGSIKSADSGATINGTVTKAQVYAIHVSSNTSSGSTDLGVVELVASYAPSGSGAGQLGFTAPPGITSVELVSTVGFRGTPSNGSDYTHTSSSACGGLVLVIATGTTTYSYSAVSPYDCQSGKTSTVPPGSAFDLHLNSVSELDASGNVVTAGGSGSWAYYKVSGTLDATLVADGMPSLSVSLTF